MNLEEQIQQKQKEIKENIDFNLKKVQLIEQESKQIQAEAQQKFNKLQQEKTQIVSQVLKDQGALEKLNELISTEDKVESK
jgi:chromosome segregation ATPase|tara:strand:- start:432 stop:674 length:243 start_codon:yes stop_codon:yes gene_type:complete